jgi:hypothetical protein
VTFDLDKIIESKRKFSKQQASLPIAEKLRILDELRERTLTIRGSLRCEPSTDDSPVESQKRMKP